MIESCLGFDMTTCEYCDKPIPWPNPYNKRFCDKLCQKTSYDKRIGLKTEWKERAPTGTVGAAHELLVCVDLMRKGYEVFRAESPSTSCDIVILRNGSLLRVEARTGMYKVNKEISYTSSCLDKSKYDVLAIIMNDGNIYYMDAEDNPLSL